MPSSHLTPGLVLTYLQSTNTKVQVSVVLGLLFSSLGGLVVAAILKKLDNVVKEYSYASANMFTALISAVLFPDKFQINVFILLAMGLLFTGIYLYEKKSFNHHPTIIRPPSRFNVFPPPVTAFRRRRSTNNFPPAPK